MQGLGVRVVDELTGDAQVELRDVARELELGFAEHGDDGLAELLERDTDGQTQLEGHTEDELLPVCVHVWPGRTGRTLVTVNSRIGLCRRHTLNMVRLLRGCRHAVSCRHDLRIDRGRSNRRLGRQLQLGRRILILLLLRASTRCCCQFNLPGLRFHLLLRVFRLSLLLFLLLLLLLLRFLLRGILQHHLLIRILLLKVAIQKSDTSRGLVLNAGVFLVLLQRLPHAILPTKLHHGLPTPQAVCDKIQ
mmetsp:Transcript_51611/g.146149  ORF Transcript_51611/g.146149 Transcript_51611/m.146149 type:complete len:248 (+) Transcript_51611:1014-1757(+)